MLRRGDTGTRLGSMVSGQSLTLFGRIAQHGTWEFEDDGTNQAHMREREVEKQTALAEIVLTLHEIGEQRRNPDRWERLCMIRAMQGIFSGCYQLAHAEARLARTPADQRVPASQLAIDPVVERADLVH